MSYRHGQRDSRRPRDSIPTRVKAYQRLVGTRGLLAAARAKAARSWVLYGVTVPGIQHPIMLRLPSSDISAYNQVFVKEEYRYATRRSPETIVDAGANGGLASIWFAHQFPEARIIAIEPERSNYELLRVNTAPYPNVTLFQGALWNDSCELVVIDPGRDKWGFMTAESPALTPHSVENTVPGMTVAEVMDRHELKRIDLLKVDIEGAELQVFQDASAWIDRVDSLVIELHERMAPGCTDSVRAATAGFEEEWWRGENLVFTRSDGCLIPPIGAH